jgi:branched-chain amino acid aminotransferase
VNGSNIQLPVGAVALNYGVSCFEGLKAFRHDDGQVRIFRPDENGSSSSFLRFDGVRWL